MRTIAHFHRDKVGSQERISRLFFHTAYEKSTLTWWGSLIRIQSRLPNSASITKACNKNARSQAGIFSSVISLKYGKTTTTQVRCNSCQHERIASNRIYSPIAFHEIRSSTLARSSMACINTLQPAVISAGAASSISL